MPLKCRGGEPLCFLIGFCRNQRYARRQVGLIEVSRTSETGAVSLNRFEQKRRREVARKRKWEAERGCQFGAVGTRTEQPDRNVAAGPRVCVHLAAGRRRTKIREQNSHLLGKLRLVGVIPQ